MTEQPFRGAMQTALAAAQQAAAHDDVPVGAVVLGPDGTVVANQHNERERRSDPTAHAEVLALSEAGTKLGRWRLNDCTMVVTLEPCVMCAGALLQSRIGRVVFGARDARAGALGSRYHVGSDPRLGHEFEVIGGLMETECSALLQTFFAERR